MVNPTEEGGLKEARDAENNTIISDSTFRNILPPQMKKMTYQYKFMCVCECFIYAKNIHSSLLTWRDRLLKQLKDRSHNTQNKRYGEISSHIFETYINAVQPHGYHIYNTVTEMAME